jgi:hypothetical protein
MKKDTSDEYKFFRRGEPSPGFSMESSVTAATSTPAEMAIAWSNASEALRFPDNSPIAIPPTNRLALTCGVSRPHLLRYCAEYSETDVPFGSTVTQPPTNVVFTAEAFGI